MKLRLLPPGLTAEVVVTVLGVKDVGLGVVSMSLEFVCNVEIQSFSVLKLTN